MEFLNRLEKCSQICMHFICICMKQALVIDGDYLKRCSLYEDLCLRSLCLSNG
jgi:hypothetical protein